MNLLSTQIVRDVIEQNRQADQFPLYITEKNEFKKMSLYLLLILQFSIC